MRAAPTPNRPCHALRGLLPLWLAAVAGLAQAQGSAGSGADGQAGPRVDAARLDYRLRSRQIAPEVWVLEGAIEDFSRANGCNIINTGFIVTEQGVLVINTGPSRLYGEQQRAAIGRVSDQPVLQVLNLNLHPDYFFGNQAWADAPTRALAGTITGMRAEGRAYEDNLYRLCGDWMKGTESLPAREAIEPGAWRVGQHELQLLRLSGHTADDLVLIDPRRRVAFVGGLVFADRVPTTPHADIAQWLHSLDLLEQSLLRFGIETVVPSHGPVRRGREGLAQTRDWLRWLDQTFSDSAERGLDLGEVMRLPIPERFAGWAAQPAEFIRSVHHLYPAYEVRALRRVTTQPVTAD